MRMTRSRVALSIAAALVAGVLTPASTAPAVAAETVTLDAQVASNAKGAFEELTKQFQVKHPNVQVEAKYLGGATIGKAMPARRSTSCSSAAASRIRKRSSSIRSRRSCGTKR